LAEALCFGSSGSISAHNSSLTSFFMPGWTNLACVGGF
jgi:hypothetical protein